MDLDNIRIKKVELIFDCCGKCPYIGETFGGTKICTITDGPSDHPLLETQKKKLNINNLWIEVPEWCKLKEASDQEKKNYIQPKEGEE